MDSAHSATLFYKLSASGFLYTGQAWSFALYSESRVAQGRLRWQLRRLLPGLGYEIKNESTEIRQRMKDLKPAWSAALVGFDLHWLDHFASSEAALRLQGQLENIEDSSKHAWLSTEALLAVLTKNLDYRRSHEERDRAKKVFHAVLRKTLTVDDVGRLRLQDLSGVAHSHLCQRLPLSQDGVCFCLDTGLTEAKYGMLQEEAPQDTVAHVFRVLLMAACNCPATKAALHALLLRVSQQIECNAPQWGPFNPLKDDEIHLHGLSGKRRKLESAYIDAVANTALEEGRARVANDVIKVIEGTEQSLSLGTSLARQVLSEFRASARLVFRDGPFTMALLWDGIRCGNPALDLLCSYFCASKKRLVCPGQPVALPDYYCTAASSLEEGSMRKYAEQSLARVLMTKSEIATAESVGKLVPDERLLRVPNKLVGTGIDMAMQNTVGWGLWAYVHPRFVVPLEPSQERHLDDWTNPITGKVSKRSVVKDGRTGKTFYEVPVRLNKAGKRISVALHSCSDLGSKGFPFALFFYQFLRARGTYFFDRWHVIVSEKEKAESASGVVMAKSQSMLETNMFRKPFDSDAGFQKLLGCGNRFFTNGDYRNKVFRVLLPDLAEALEILGEEDSDELARQVFEACRRAWASLRKGFEAKNNRWWSAEERFCSFRKYRPICGLVVIIYGFERKWWVCIEQCPIVNHFSFHDTDRSLIVAEDAQIEDDGGPAEVAFEEQAGTRDAEDGDQQEQLVQRCTKSAASKAMKELRNNTPAVMRFVAKTLSRAINARLFNFLWCISTPLRESFYEEQEMLKSGGERQT